jgi:uncharacterized protein YbjT (DUF2867 family)
MDKKAIVIGATGVVGREVVKTLSLCDEISEIITFTRREYEFNSPKVINYVIDFDEIDNYADLVEGEFLFSCLGTTKSQVGSIEKQRIVDFSYQLKFAQVAATNGVHHYLLVSSPGADELSSNPYLKMKGDLDTAVNALDFASINLFKPMLIDGKRDDSRPAERLGVLLTQPLKYIPGLKKYQKIKGIEIAQKMVYEALKLPRGKKEYALDQLFDLGDS